MKQDSDADDGRGGRASRSVPDTLAPGSLVDRYVILGERGRGGMGVVYAAYDPELGRKVAIKLLHPFLEGASTEAHTRLLREAQAMARLSHPNVVAIHDVGTSGEDVFLAMDLVEGCTLTEWLREPRPWRKALDVLKAAGRGLSAAHKVGIVHRDFKPDNVLIANDGRITVTDFGIASADAAIDKLATAEVATVHRSSRAMAVAGTPPNAPSSGSVGPLTGSDHVLGTVGFMAPEQAWSEVSDARSDQFSFCATLFFALYGQLPFPGTGMEEYLNALDKKTPEVPADTGVPAWLRKSVLRGLSHDAAHRYASMDALLTALDQDPAPRQRQRLAWGGLALAIAAAVGVIAWRERARARACVDSDLLVGVWDDAARQQVRAAFAASEDTYARVARVLDDYATGLESVEIATCEARRDRTEDASSLALRSACIDRRRVELRALTALFARADENVRTKAIEAASNLVPPRWCADTNGLRAAVGLPDDRDQRARVLDVRKRIAEAESLRVTGKLAEAVRAVDEAIEEARAIPHSGTEAEALYLAGNIQQALGTYAESLAPYKQAVWAAERAGNDALVARAAARLAFSIGDKAFRLSEGEDWMSLADAALVRLGPNEDVEADVLSVRAVLLTTHGHAERAIPLHERLIEIRRRVNGRAQRVTASAINNLGYAYQQLGQHAKALPLHEEVLSIDEKIFGPADPILAIDYANLGSTYLGLGRLSDARTALARAVAIAEGATPTSFWAAWALSYQSVAATRDGDADAGLSSAEHGLSIAAGRPATMERVGAPLLVGAGVAHLAKGDAARARERCERAVALQESHPTTPDAVYEWDALGCVGAAELSLARPEEARRYLERSVALTRRVFPGDLARSRFALARALEQLGEVARARVLAEQARAEYAEHPELEAPRLEVERWLAAHR